MRFFSLRWIWILGVLLLPRIAIAQSQPQPQSCPIDLPTAIASHLNQPEWARSRWGVVVQDLNSGQYLYRHNAERYFLPASNAKLLTTAAALNRLGPNWRVQTPIQWQGNTSQLTHLHISGQGDPTLTTAKLQDWARSLQAQGIRSIDRLTVSSGEFPNHHPTWELYDTNFYYAVPVSGLILNENSFRLTVLPQGVGEQVQWQTDDAIAIQQWQIQNQGYTSAAGSPYELDITGVVGEPTWRIHGRVAADNGPDNWDMAIRDSRQYFLATLGSQLTQVGITVGSSTVIDRAPDLPRQQTWNSPAIADLIRATNEPSQNLYAEILLHHTGGISALTASLTELGVEPETYQLVDGSGLSRHNLVSPDAIAQTLYGIAQSENYTTFRNSLPVAAQTGTLRRRFRESAVAGQVWAKTGTLTNVSALSGYLDQPGEEPLVFSILLNQATASVGTQRRAIDAIVLTLAAWQKC